MCHPYKKIIDKIEDRIHLLRENGTKTIDGYENEYAELLEAVSKVVGTALLKELEDLHQFVLEQEQQWQEKKS